jgi:hypothetical protein
MKVGVKYGLPLDLMKLVYKFKLDSEDGVRDKERMFQKNVILMLIFSRPNEGWVENLERIWNSRFKRLTNAHDFEEEDVYRAKMMNIPEISFWITSSPQAPQEELMGPKMNTRGHLMKCIKILGEEGYLWEAICDVQPASHPGAPRNVITQSIPCSLKKKIKYLNTSCWEEVGRDYDEFRKDATLRGLHVDSWGDSYYLN